MKAIYHQETHSLEEQPDMKEPDISKYPFPYPACIEYQEANDKYNKQKTLCKTYPVSGTVPDYWLKGEVLEEGIDYKIENHYKPDGTGHGEIFFVAVPLKENKKEEDVEDFYVECNVCKQILKNWSGSTPCCGSISNLVEEDGTPIKPTKTKTEILAKITGHHADLLETAFLDNEAVTPREAFEAMEEYKKHTYNLVEEEVVKEDEELDKIAHKLYPDLLNESWGNQREIWKAGYMAASAPIKKDLEEVNELWEKLLSKAGEFRGRKYIKIEDVIEFRKYYRINTDKR